LMFLERESKRIHDKFLKLALEMAVDGYQPEDIRHVLQSDLDVSYSEANRAVTIFESFGAYAPAMGLIGTLLGLIGLLGELGNPSALGASMGVALLSTLYGAVLSNMFFLPLAGRIETRSQEEIHVKQITLEGAVCLARQESPIIVGQRLGTFLVSGVERGIAAA
jgi:chemotaxis protein MotA